MQTCSSGTMAGGSCGDSGAWSYNVFCGGGSCSGCALTCTYLCP
jgi:hypothetical protein